MAKYLLTGAAGFIAANVARQLLDSGHEVVGIDNLNDAYNPRSKSGVSNSFSTPPAFSPIRSISVIATRWKSSSNSVSTNPLQR